MSALLNHVHVPLPHCIGKTRSPDGLRSRVFRITPALAKRHGIQPMLILGTKDGSVALGVIRGDATELSFIWSEDPGLRHEAAVKPSFAVLRMLDGLMGGAA